MVRKSNENAVNLELKLAIILQIFLRKDWRSKSDRSN